MGNTASIIFQSLVKDYLATAASVSAGVPSTATVPVSLVYDGSAAKRKEMVLLPSEEGQLVTITGNILAPMKKDADDANGKTLIELDTWRKAIMDRLADQPAFYSWLAALPEERRTGFRLLGMREPQVLIHGVDAYKQALVVPFTIAFAVITRAH
jgi:hypothetical protein